MWGGNRAFCSQNRHAIKIGQLCLQNVDQLSESTGLLLTGIVILANDSQVNPVGTGFQSRPRAHDQ